MFNLQIREGAFEVFDVFVFAQAEGALGVAVLDAASLFGGSVVSMILFCEGGVCK